MRRFTRLALWFLLPLLVLAGLLLALQRWVTGEGFRDRLAAEASELLGAPVRAQAIGLALWPVPGVAVDGLSVQARTPLSLQRVELRPRWSALLAGQLRVQTLVVRQAVLPEATIALLGARIGAANAKPAPADGDEAIDFSLLPRELVLDEVSWLAADGARTTVNADLRFAEDGWPAKADLAIVGGALRGTTATLRREGEATAWALDARVGGGRVRGPVEVKLPGPGAAERRVVLEGSLRTDNVEVSALTAPSKPLTGRLQAETTLGARFPERVSADALVTALRSDTRFTVTGATLHGLDLVRAVSTVGLSSGGLTQLDTLAGQVSTRGKAIQLSNLVASSGLLAATGDVAISPSRALSGRVRVDVTRGATAGVVGVPLAVGGTLDDPQVTLTRAALLGAAIGTAVMPGVGTGAGANLGDRLGEGIKDLFGGKR
ncbi:MAG: AsmA family protein [Hydrogenophaga sp.]|uniref:AsmA family protein n=1 Tax=Hydrogenophaga sp. TaxID=1904254 RepID=UPI00169111DB|nr:AsmA family protein [Hydrogenophaga sp.]NIM40326.1 AsmA family protein [Hydrogenophaga sp.]NIN25557.1 AsmA family protein [Hydrogenophaga sp.]NIN30209.1 AsmA family protein [Hydrogenophaga sp.]NIN54510.1 AsmA family protein [Hydrogenophaga sp.]NIO50383.1 AsmA family protein [Hydrogenophaga sp.]